MRTEIKLLIVLLLIGAISGACLWVSDKQASVDDPQYLHNGAVVMRQAESFWRSKIASEGPDRAYAQMVEAARPLVYLQSHALAHSFGLSLFKELDLAGLAHCGPDLAWGCAHHFVAVAIEEHGGDVVDELMDVCKTRGDEIGIVACEHGIGHGLVGYGDYSLDSLKRILPSCERLSPGARINGCMTGAFMEYNFRRLESYKMNDSIPLVPLTDENVYGPCFDVDEASRPTCVRELPDWWTASETKIPFDIRVERMGARCEAVDTDADGLSGICFEGLGKIIAANDDLDAARISASCRRATASAEFRLRCLSGAAYEFRAAREPDYASACERLGLSDDALRFCAAYVAASPAERGRSPVPDDVR